MKPIIGIVSRPMKNESARDVLATYKKVSDVIIEFGGLPIMIIPPILNNYNDELNEESKKELEYILKLCDGIILQGGDDFYKYDEFIAKYAYNNNIPTLGICLGMQLMSYIFNGKMGHVDNHLSNELYVHNNQILKETKLYNTFNNDNILVNSRHKDYIISTDLKVNSISSDGIIEGVEDSNKDFYIGVQWHPESMTSYDKNSCLIFKNFIKASLKHQNGN